VAPTGVVGKGANVSVGVANRATRKRAGGDRQRVTCNVVRQTANQQTVAVRMGNAEINLTGNGSSRPNQQPARSAISHGNETYKIAWQAPVVMRWNQHSRKEQRSVVRQATNKSANGGRLEYPSPEWHNAQKVEWYLCSNNVLGECNAVGATSPYGRPPVTNVTHPCGNR